MPLFFKRKAVKFGASKMTKSDLENFKRTLEYDHHTIPLEDLCERLDTHPEYGLTHKTAKRKLENQGPNTLTAFKQRPSILIFAKYFFGYFALYIWIGTILSVVAYILKDEEEQKEYLKLMIVNVLIVFVSSVILSVEESHNRKLIEAFKLLVPEFATVIREGEKLTLRVEDIVLGDLVSVKFGDRIPADMRIIEAHNFKVDVSLIADDSEPAVRGPENSEPNPLEAKNVVFFSSPVVEGYAKAIVIGCGDSTHLGRIAGLTCGLGNKLPPLANELNNVLHFVTGIGLVVSIFIVFVNFYLKRDWLDVMIILIGIFYSSAPNILLITITACLSIVAKRMVSKNCLVKKFQSVETLGTTSIICTDKTGILTQNKMSVAHLWYDGQTAKANHPEDRHDILYDHNGPSFWALARIAVLCNRAEIKSGQEDISIIKKEVTGDASEAALLKYMEITVGDVMVMRKHNPKVAEIPFNHLNKYQLSIHKNIDNEQENYFLVMKGSPEKVFEKCDTILVEGREQIFDDTWKNKINEAAVQLSNMGERVLAFCDYDLTLEGYPSDYEFKSDEINFPLDGFRFVGLISLIDPPRYGVPHSVALCRTAGIKLIMITGDSALAAKAFAKNVGIISNRSETLEDVEQALKRTYPAYPNEPTAAVVLGNKESNLSQTNLEQIFMNYDEIVFARCSAQKKLAIVECCQSFGAIVAVTGDGINDSPALKKADISASLGVSGSHVCREVADIILLDDSFASLVSAIRESRLCFDNLKKTIAYSLTSNIPQLVPFISAFILNHPWPTNLFTVVCIKVGTDLFPAISLIFEEEDIDMMSFPPRDPYNDHIVNIRLISVTQGQIGMIQAAAALVAFFVIMRQHGFKPERLIDLREHWDSKNINNLKDSFNNEWTYKNRKELLGTCQTAVFLSIVLVQVADLLICRTRNKSIFQIGMKNYILNLALLFELVLAVCFVYIPGVNQFLQMKAIHFFYWFPAIPFAILIFAYDELRRLYIRRHPGCWLEKETVF